MKFVSPRRGYLINVQDVIIDKRVIFVVDGSKTKLFRSKVIFGDILLGNKKLTSGYKMEVIPGGGWQLVSVDRDGDRRVSLESRCDYILTDENGFNPDIIEFDDIASAELFIELTQDNNDDELDWRYV